ncbi:MAG: hypothetical protein GPJ51_15135 [Candidatus Heimdallarchaeota archaeon]|nr:hypothetical protein [Candidatus Heimdallarchaeota archaeon]
MDKKQVFLLRLSETVNADEWDSANVYNTYKGWLTPEDGVGEDVSFYSHNNSQMIKEQIKGAEFKEISSDIFLVDCWDHFDGLKENCFKSKVLENLADYRVYIRRNIFSLIHKKIWQSKSFIGETGSLRRIGLATGIRDEYDKKGMKYQKKFLSLKFEYDAYSGNPIDYYFFLGFSREEIDIIITSISKYWENQRETIIEAQREKEKEQRRKEKEQEENRIKDRIIELSNKRESAELGQNYTLEELVDALELGVIDKNSLSIDVIVKKLGSPPELDYDNVFGRGLIVLLEYGEVAVEPFWELFQPVAYTERYEELINDYEKILDKVV